MMNAHRTLYICGLGMMLLSSGCGTTRTITMRYHETESLVIGRLGVNKHELTDTQWKQTQIHVDDELGQLMLMRIFTVKLKDYTPDDHISFTAYHEYDIGANGGEYVDFSIRKVDENRTKVSVDYSDRAVGCCLVIPLPFAYQNPGICRERRILNYILQENVKKEAANKALQPTRVP